MGAFFTNYHVRTSNKNACIRALQSLIHTRAMVVDPENEWITIYDETSESQDIKELRRLAKGLSSKLKTGVFSFMVHDSDIFVYLFYENGKLIDQFDSKPDYFGPATKERRAKWSGHFERLVKYAPRTTTAETISDILFRPQLIEEERAAELAGMLGINQHRARLGFKYAKEEANDCETVYGKRHSARDADLIEAVSKRDIATVKTLLSEGVSPNAKDNLGFPLLVEAIRHGALEIAQALIAAGADVLAEGKLKGDALWIASANGRREILELLLNKAKGDRRLGTSLSVAFTSGVLGGHLEVIRLLLEAGVDVNKQDEKGNSPLMFASVRGLHGEYERRNNRPYHVRPDQQQTDWNKVVEVLLAAGANPNLQTSEGVTALMGAAVRGLHGICILLLNGGADANLKTMNGLTAAGLARAAGHLSIEELLRS